MIDVLISVSGWLLVLLLPVTIALPFRVRRAARIASADDPSGRHLRRHYRLGYLIASVALGHAAVSTGTGDALRAGGTGLTLATGALLLVCVQVVLGLLLREPSLRDRPALRRRHVWVMVGIVTLALGHIALNSAFIHRIVG